MLLTESESLIFAKFLHAAILKYLFTFCAFLICLSIRAQLTYETLRVDYDSAWQYKDLKIIPIRQKRPGGRPQDKNIISLSQAIRQHLASVSERGTASTENVHYLRINNNSDKSLFISSGEVIAGGRQDRIVARDTILTPSVRDQYIPVMCVEEGRWSEKEKKFTYSNFANPRLRKVLDVNKNQVLIWKEIDNQLAAGKMKNRTLAYLTRTQDKKMTLINDEYFSYFQNKFRATDSSIVGFVCVSGNRILGCDIFDGTDLFYNQLEPLLKGYIDEAVFYGAPITLAIEEVKKYMDKVLINERSQQQFVSGNGKIFRHDGQVIHINTF